jgi:hypothetical protein
MGRRVRRYEPMTALIYFDHVSDLLRSPPGGTRQ